MRGIGKLMTTSGFAYRSLPSPVRRGGLSSPALREKGVKKRYNARGGLRALRVNVCGVTDAYLRRRRMAVMPVLLVLLMIFRPRGIMGLRELRWFVPGYDLFAIKRWRAKKEAGHDAAAAD